MKENIKRIHCALLVFSGFLTLVLENMAEMEGGGVSLIVVLTIPFFIVVSIIFSAIAYKMIKPNTRRYESSLLLIFFHVFLIGGAFGAFPFK